MVRRRQCWTSRNMLTRISSQIKPSQVRSRHLASYFASSSKHAHDRVLTIARLNARGAIQTTVCHNQPCWIPTPSTPPRLRRLDCLAWRESRARRLPREALGMRLSARKQVQYYLEYTVMTLFKPSYPRYTPHSRLFLSPSRVLTGICATSSKI